MRLKNIKLAGFKSFVDPTTVLFPREITVIVGPNGCGKSNIIDAVRWVMGESSAKNLRGESLADVIFNGSTGRKPVGQASIELNFDNSDGGLGGEYASYSEISVRRQITRDGQSVYFLNGTKCRRRDITDVFLGTGLGPRSYAIIEQGTISRLIEAKPEELRHYLEEVAGIAKYKERRKETETRIRHTRENLDRLNDLREELEKQLDRLKRQSAAAERYNELKTEGALVKGQLYALRFQAFSARLANLQQQIQEKEVAIEAANAELSAIVSGNETLREAQLDASDRFNNVQENFYKIGSQIARLEQTLAHHRERHTQLSSDKTEIERNIQELSGHREQDAELQLALQAELDELIPQTSIAEEQAYNAQEVLSDTDAKMQDWQGRWDEFNQTAAQAQREAQVKQTRIQHIEEQLENSHRTIARKQEELNRLESNPLGDAMESLNENILIATEEEAEKREVLEQAQASIQQTRLSNDALVQQIAQQRTSLQQQQGRYASLEALQQAALGQQEGVAVEWLKQKGLADKPRLAQNLQVDTGWELAAETVLGFYLQAVCVDDINEAAQALQNLSKGQVSLLATQAQGSMNAQIKANSLLNKITSSLPIASLIGHVYVAEDVLSALDLIPQLAAHESVITKDGLWLGQGWARLNREHDAKAGVIAREKEIKQLEQQIEMHSEQVQAAETQLTQGRAQLQQFEQGRENAQKEMSAVNNKLSDLRSQLRVQQTRLEHQRQRIAELSSEVEEQQEGILNYQEDLLQTRELWQEALQAMEQQNDLRLSLQAQRDSLRLDLEQAREQARKYRETAHQLNLKAQGHRTQLSALEQNLNRLQQQLASLEQRQILLDNMLLENEEPLPLLTDELETTLAQRLHVETDLADARRHLESVDHELRAYDHKRQDVETKINHLREALEKTRMEWQELHVRRKTIEEQLAEMDYVLETLVNEMPQEANIAEHEEKLTRIEEKITRLGAINLAAIEEFQSESERKTYLDAQNADLEEALATLEAAIAKIDKETMTRFEETFNQVNAGIQTLFPKIFGGGRAYLEMTGDDLLNTGISIMAQPPGKKNSTIHLLSGGEKALTAMALVFSLFQLNPAPFCMLDEVDAPLDDANVFRFCNLVKEMAAKVQFIVISHNKVTMEMAHHLSGVTMHEPGVSRIVAVDVEAAAALAGA